MKIHRFEFLLAPKPRGIHLVTDEVVSGIHLLPKVRTGLAHIFLQHTSASLSLNENADPTVRKDLERHLNALAPDHMPYYTHIAEGGDDMSAHIKTSLLGCSLTIPVADGQFNLGPWQGVYLCEHRDTAGPRSVVVTILTDD